MELKLNYLKGAIPIQFRSNATVELCGGRSIFTLFGAALLDEGVKRSIKNKLNNFSHSMKLFCKIIV
jgi:hypothetical protein